jgi:dienelactone hydrolase
VYTTGQSTDRAIVCVYDIFGFWNQTEIGADTLAGVLNAKVFMPDFFEPHGPFPLSRFPPKSDDDKAALQSFFGGPAEVGKTVSKLNAFGKALRSDGFKQVVVYGFCWGKLYLGLVVVPLHPP